MSWTGGIPTGALWYGNLRTQPITIISNYEYLNVKFLSTTLTTASTINAINVNSFDMNTITFSTNQIHLSSNTILTGANASLYINGILVTDASNASNTSQWADFPAINTINANNKNLTNLNTLFGNIINASNIYNNQTFWGSNINVSTINLRGLLTGSNITCSNITVRNTVSAANGNFTTTTANDAVFVNTTSIFTNTTLLASVNGTITTLSNTNLKSRTANISNFYGKLMYGENLFLSSIIALSNIYGATIEGETLDVARIITDTDIYGSNLFVSTIITEGIVASNIQIGSITGDGFSFITVGTGNFNTLNASNIVSSNSIHSNIYSYNIYNSNAISTDTLTTTGLATLSATTVTNNTTTGSLNVTNDSQLNTLTTNGTYTANGDINLGEYGGNNMDINGRTYSYLSIDGTQTQWFNSINNILNLTTNELNVIGCATGNYFFPLRNNSIVNIGQTEFSPGIVTIYGLNLEDTYALTVYGSTYLGGFLTVLGDSTINGLFTVNGVSDLNGDTTVLGFLDCLGTLDVAGLTTFTGAVNTAGLVTIQGVMNVTGTFTSQTGMGIIGATTFQLGDIIIGSSPGGGVTNNYNVYIYYNGLDIQNITVNGTGDFRQSVSILGNLTARNFVTSNITASNITVRTITTSNIIASNITVPTITATNIITSNLTATNINFSNITTFTTTNLNTSNLTVNTSANINTQLYLRQNDTLSYDPTLIFENTNTAKSATIELTSQGSLNFNSDDISIIANSNLLLGTNSNVFIVSPNPIRVYSQIRLSEYPALNSNPTQLIFTNESNTKSASIAFDSTSNLLTIQSSNLDIGATTVNIVGTSNIYMNGVSSIVLRSDDTIINGLSNVGILSEFGNAFITGVVQTVVGGGVVNIQSVGNIDIGAGGNIFSQCDGELTLNSLSNTLITATGTIAVGAQGDAQFVSVGGRCIIASGGSQNVEINAVGTGSIIANTFGTGGILLYNGSNNGIAINNTAVSLGSDGDINLTASNTINLSSTGNTSIIGNDVGIIAQDSLVLSGVTNVTIEAGQVDFIDSSNINFNNTTLSNIGTLYASNATIASISTLRLSTGTLFADSISSINFQASNIQASNIFTSTLRATNTMTASTIAIDRIVGFNSATNIFTNNLFPLSAGAQVGYGPTLAGGGYYNFGFHRSTFTTNINPATDGSTTANNIKVAGHLSTTSLGVSTINFKPYPFISTLNNSVITTTATTTSGTPGLTRLQSNTLRFPFPGTYKVFQEYAISKGSGGGIHGSLIYASNGATATTVANATNWVAQGMSSCPFQDTAGVSTFTTAVTTILANSANLTRDLYYYDSGSGNYTASFYITPPQITYIPSPGILPDI
jgi:hypothetical protein